MSTFTLDIEGLQTITGKLEFVVAPDPLPSEPDGLWTVRGDEELLRFGFASRTAGLGEDKDWDYLPQSPSVFRYNNQPRKDKKDGKVKDLYRADISRFRGDILRIHNWNEKDDKAKLAYLFSGGTALFNGNSYPRQQYLVMSFNKLELLEVTGDWLKFKTVKPTDSISHMTPATHPQFIHKWDIVTMRDGETIHVDTPHGVMYYVLCSNEGYGYIPMEFVRKEV